MPNNLLKQTETPDIEPTTNSREQPTKAPAEQDRELISIILSLRQMLKKAEACRKQSNELIDEITSLRQKLFLLLDKVEIADKESTPLDPSLPYLEEVQTLLEKTSTSEYRRNIKRISLSNAAIERLCLLLDEMNKEIEKKYRPNREPDTRPPLQRKDIIILGLLLQQLGSLVTLEELSEISGYKQSCMRVYIYILNARLKEFTHYRIIYAGKSCKIVTI